VSSKLTKVTGFEKTNITTIPINCFDGHGELTSISLPSSITAISNFAFRNCAKLTDITFTPSNNFTIGTNAFQNCGQLTNASANILLSRVTTIGTDAFNGCTPLSDIIFGTALTAINSTAFANCSALTTMTFATQNPPTTVAATAFGSGTTAAPITTINLSHASPDIEA